MAPLNVAVDAFSPPFIMQGADQQFYGFDIGMMEYICQQLKRKCVFQPMTFSNLLNAVENNKADVAVGSIVITPERALRVNFSSPYLPSQARFFGYKKYASSFNLKSLSNQYIGVETGTLYPQVIATLPIDNPKIKEYPNANALLAALQNEDVRVVLIDNPAAVFWQNQVSDIFVALGTPFNYGFGLGIVVNKSQTDLLTQINQALASYLSSAQFKVNFNSYLNYF
jgi:ABC-type amino acid transport substrate-binding protein